MFSSDKLHDFRFVTNPHIMKELSKRIIQRLDECNKPNFEWTFPIYSVIVDFKNIGCIDVYTPLYDRNCLSKIIGFIVTRVELLKLKRRQNFYKNNIFQILFFHINPVVIKI